MLKLQRLLALLLALGCATASGADEPNASLVSFADLYRLTVTGRLAMADGPASASFADAPEVQIRVAALQAPAAAEPRFTIAPASGPGRWVLLLAGVAAF